MEYIPSENALNVRKNEEQDSSKLVEHLSTQRKFQLEHYFKNDPRMFEMEKKYGKYLMVPLAIPKFELEDPDHFVDWFFKHSIRPVKQKGDYVAPDKGFSPFYSVDLIQEVGDDWNLNMQTDNFKQEFPKLWDQFHETLPVQKILTLNLWSSVWDFNEHRDSAEMWDCPNSFRIPLYDENPSNTLFVMDNPTVDYKVEETHFLPTLEDTNTFMWNNLRCMHGSRKTEEHKKIMAVVIALVDPDKYDTLMSASVEKYKDYVLESKYQITDYVNV